MDDPRAHRIIPDRKLAVYEEPLYQGGSGLSRAGVHDQSRRLVNNDDLVILVEDGKIDLRGSEERFLGNCPGEFVIAV